MIAIFLLISSLLVFSLNHLTTNSNRFQLKETTKTLVVGHSHAECAVNDNNLESVQNIAESGEAYFYTYLKVQHLINDNPQIENIVIEFSNNQVSIIAEEGLWEKKYMNYRFPHYSFLMRGSDYYEFFRKGKSSIFSSLSLSIQDQFSFFISGESAPKFFQWGGHISLDKKYEKGERWGEFKETKYLVNSRRSIEDIKKLIDVCLDNDIRVILFRAPVHQDYQGRINEISYQKTVRQFIESGIDYYDYGNLSLEDSCYADAAHLNKYGASIFTRYLVDQHPEIFR